MYSKWVSGHQRRQHRNRVGNWLKARGGRDKVVIATKVGLEMPGVGQGLRRHYTLPARRGFAEALTDRPYRSLSVSTPTTRMHRWKRWRPTTSSSGRARCRPAMARCCSSTRRAWLKPLGRFSAPNSLPRSSALAAALQHVRTRRLRARAGAAGFEESIGVIPYYSLASGFLTGKYRTEAGVRERARAAAAPGDPQQARPAHSQSFGRRLRTSESQPGPGGSRVAHRAPQHHRPHRQRHQPRSIQGSDRRRASQARRRRDQGAGYGEPIAISPPALLLRLYFVQDPFLLVVDACQARITSAALHDYLERDGIVFVTGSKFMGGPPFSGFALVPRRIAGRRRRCPRGWRRSSAAANGRRAGRAPNGSSTAPIPGCCCGSRRRSSSSSGSSSWTRPTSSGSSSPSTPRSAPRSSRRLQPTAWRPIRPATGKKPTPTRSRCGRCRRSIFPNSFRSDVRGRAGLAQKAARRGRPARPAGQVRAARHRLGRDAPGRAHHVAGGGQGGAFRRGAGPVVRGRHGEGA